MWLRIGIFALLLVSAISLLIYNDFDVARILQQIQASDPLLFLLFMIILPLVGFPIAAFYLFAGSAFPWPQAWALCAIALAINQLAAWLIARYILKQPIERLLTKWQFTPVLPNERNSFRLVFMIRTIPGIPYPIQNYLLALAGVPFLTYWSISWIVQSIFAAGMTAVGAMLIGRDSLIVWLIIALFTLLIIIKFSLKLIQNRKIAKA